MRLYTVKYWLDDKSLFSIPAIERSIITMAFGALGLVGLALLTFGGEYISGLTLERLCETIGLLQKNWLGAHHSLFLHEIQIVFLITFCLELLFILARFIKGWSL